MSDNPAEDREPTASDKAAPRAQSTPAPSFIGGAPEPAGGAVPSAPPAGDIASPYAAPPSIPAAPEAAPPPADYASYPPPEPPRRTSGGSIWLGIGIGLGVGALAWILSFALGSYPDGVAYLLFIVFALPIIWLIVGIVLAAIPRTTRTGGGLLIALGASVLISGGVCVALITGVGA